MIRANSLAALCAAASSGASISSSCAVIPARIEGSVRSMRLNVYVAMPHHSRDLARAECLSTRLDFKLRHYRIFLSLDRALFFRAHWVDENDMPALERT